MKNGLNDSGADRSIAENCIIGQEHARTADPVRLGDHVTIRSNTVIYTDVVIGDYFQTGHNVVIREFTSIGNHVVIGTNTVIDGNVEIDDFVKIESNCYIPTHVRIGRRVFLGPNVTLTNDKYPLKMRDAYVPEGPVIGDNVTLGAGSIVLPGITVGEGSVVAAGAVVTGDVPPGSLVAGVPGKILPLPEYLREDNTALSWRKYLDE